MDGLIKQKRNGGNLKECQEEKGELASDHNKVHCPPQGKSAQVKVSPGSGRGGPGGTNSPCPPSLTQRMTPPEDNANKAPIIPMQTPLHPVMQYFHYHSNPHGAPTPPALLGQFIDPKNADLGFMGVAHNSASNNNATGNSNNNNFTSEALPLAAHRQGLLPPAGCLALGAGSGVRGPFKAGPGGTPQPQPGPQPAHTNMGVLQGKSLITMPPDPKPGSPVIPMSYVGLRPGADLQGPLGQGLVTSSAGGPGMEPGPGGPQRLPTIYHMPYGRGQGGPIAATHMGPAVHQTQPGVIPFPLVTRSVQTSHPGSASVMTVSASHAVTIVTASHQTATTAAAAPIHRSPSHNTASSVSNGQRDSSNESMMSGTGGGSVSNVLSDSSSLRSSPLQHLSGSGGGVGVTVTQVGAPPSPPVSHAAHHAGCQQCAHGSGYPSGQQQYQVMYPIPYIQGPNNLIQHPAAAAAISQYYPPGGQQLMSGMMTNGYSPEMYSYSHPGYPTLSPANHLYPMMPSNTLYHSQSQPTGPGPTPQPAGNGTTPIPSQAPAPTVIGGGASVMGPSSQQQLGPGGSSVSIKQRNTGCYNCGVTGHKAADCPEISMENMSGKSVYMLDYKPHDESD